MWGIPRPKVSRSHLSRFIPTHVGNTGTGPGTVEADTVHPHACGEYVTARRGIDIEIGSSPRMWGIHGRQLPPELRSRFIPTHVGNTWPARNPRESPSVHPHACGEYPWNPPPAPCWPGSSPRMWGILHLLHLERQLSRFIPTHVGNTAFCFSSSSFCAVHPHACGEYVSSSARAKARDGSSPRMWGILIQIVRVNAQFRFIPTHVGNTADLGGKSVLIPVHPHACGEYSR